MRQIAARVQQITKHFEIHEMFYHRSLNFKQNTKVLYLESLEFIQYLNVPHTHNSN